MLFKKYDVFISYAVEDKATVAAPLTEKLKARGLKVFFAGRELGIGDEIGDLIHTGLRKSKFGVVILSPSYNRSWTLGELFNLLDKENQEKHATIFPIWHEISYTEVLEKFPRLSSKYALSTNSDLDHIAREVSAKVTRWKRRRYMAAAKRFGGFTLPVLVFSLFRQFTPGVSIPQLLLPSLSELNPATEIYVSGCEQKREEEIRRKKAACRNRREERQKMIETWQQFSSDNKNVLHEYSFTDNRHTIRGKKHLQDIPLSGFDDPEYYFGISRPEVYLLDSRDNYSADTSFLRRYYLVNTRQPGFKCDSIRRHNNQIYVRVKITNNIRTAELLLLKKTSATRNCMQYIKLSGFYPEKWLLLYKENKTWKLREDDPVAGKEI